MTILNRVKYRVFQNDSPDLKSIVLFTHREISTIQSKVGMSFKGHMIYYYIRFLLRCLQNVECDDHRYLHATYLRNTQIPYYINLLKHVDRHQVNGVCNVTSQFINITRKGIR